MALLDLPPELLNDIVDLTLPDGLESFVLTCKTIHEIGKSHIARHNSYRQEWKHVVCPENTSSLMFIQLFNAIAGDPLIACYIESVEFLGLNHSQADYHRIFQGSTYYERPQRTEAALAGVKQLLHHSRYLELAMQDPDTWFQELCPVSDGDQQAQHGTVFLLTLLPNLKELSLPFAWKDLMRRQPALDTGRGRESRPNTDLDVWSVLDTITQEANEPTSNTAALSKLERILPHANMSYETRNGMYELETFLALPSMREVYTCNLLAVDDKHTGIPFWWRYANLDSGLRKIELVACCIDGGGISELVRHTPQLESLKYSHHTKWHGCLHDWDAGEFVGAIGKERGSTLKELAVTIDCLFGDVEIGVASMKEFQALENLELDVRVFCAPSADFGDRRGIAGFGRKGWTLKSVPCLADILPPSLKRASLFTGSCDDGERDEDILGLKSLFLHFADKQCSMLPGLRSLTVRSANGELQWQDLTEPRLDPKGTLSPAAIRELGLGGAASEAGRQPTWKEEFHRRFGPLDE